jgi:flagellar basal-body rod protein FlgB
VTAPIDAGLGLFQQALALRGYRQEILSADIANANTPGFKAVDLDFKEALSAAIGSATTTASAVAPAVWQVSDPRHLSPTATATPAAAAQSVKYQTDNQGTLDGNSVDVDREKVTAAANAVDYAATATFTTQTIRMLTTAIGGAGAQQSGGG